MGTTKRRQASLYVLAKLETELGEEPLVLARLVSILKFGSHLLASFSAGTLILGNLLQIGLFETHLDDVSVCEL